MLQSLLQRFRRWYVMNQTEHAAIPEFKPDRICRYRVRFSGHVQNVGFRMEAAQMAHRLELSGYCENLPDGDVLAEFQGPENKIIFMIAFMESIKRIVIENKIIQEMPFVPNETAFRY